ncbi:hypothetical protein BH11GEM1_BH11GEM1_29550 [soil metagenome]
MSDLHDNIVLLLGVAVGALVLAIRSYAGEKGKNLATREDLNTVTRALEQIKVDSQAAIDREKAVLEQYQLINWTQYELELAAYRDVWLTLLPVHRAASALRPLMDYGLREGETEESRKHARLALFGDSFNPFSEAVWKHRPFYPEAVFASLNEVLRLMRSEALEYQHFDQFRHADYWEKAMDSVKVINEQVDQVADTIRTRLSNARVA